MLLQEKSNHFTLTAMADFFLAKEGIPECPLSLNTPLILFHRNCNTFEWGDIFSLSPVGHVYCIIGVKYILLKEN